MYVYRGAMEIKMAPKAVTLKEENDLLLRFEELEKELEGQDGDDDEEDE